MTNDEISLKTKKNLARALKLRMECMPLDKIKVSHIAKDCDITRSSFYYHFKDIYDLLEWTFNTEAVILLDKSTDVQTWEEGILLFMDYLQKNEKLFRSAYNSMGRVLMEKFIFKKAKHLMQAFVDGIKKDNFIEKEYEDFIVSFYTSAYISLLLNWFIDGMKIPPKRLTELIEKTVKGDIEAAVERARFFKT